MEVQRLCSVLDQHLAKNEFGRWVFYRWTSERIQPLLRNQCCGFCPSTSTRTLRPGRRRWKRDPRCSADCRCATPTVRASPGWFPHLLKLCDTRSFMSIFFEIDTYELTYWMQLKRNKEWFPRNSIFITQYEGIEKLSKNTNIDSSLNMSDFHIGLLKLPHTTCFLLWPAPLPPVWNH